VCRPDDFAMVGSKAVLTVVPEHRRARGALSAGYVSWGVFNIQCVGTGVSICIFYAVRPGVLQGAGEGVAAGTFEGTKRTAGVVAVFVALLYPRLFEYRIRGVDIGMDGAGCSER